MAMSVKRRIERNLPAVMGQRDPEAMIRVRSTDPIRASGLVPRQQAGHMTASDYTRQNAIKPLPAGGHPHMTVEQTLRWQFHRMVVPHTGSVTAFGVPTTARSVAIKDESSICSPPLPLGSAVTFDYRATTLQPRRRFTVTDALMAGLTHGLVPATSRDRLALRMAGTCPAMTVEQTLRWAQWLRLAFRP